ncbi:hypothetical protein Tsubulata_042243 [Turnera subulata]|uniref:Uncharacterized protein n=1 Tax=Turnera subulata TaxID=218843 RepID=A0A9Q0G605_9ROSI|nr:hypothetical protein Tsubulata_042243 [Turnera subulata]
MVAALEVERWRRALRSTVFLTSSIKDCQLPDETHNEYEVTFFDTKIHTSSPTLPPSSTSGSTRSSPPPPPPPLPVPNLPHGRPRHRVAPFLQPPHPEPRGHPPALRLLLLPNLPARPLPRPAAVAGGVPGPPTPRLR